MRAYDRLHDRAAERGMHVELHADPEVRAKDGSMVRPGRLTELRVTHGKATVVAATVEPRVRLPAALDAAARDCLAKVG